MHIRPCRAKPTHKPTQRSAGAYAPLAVMLKDETEQENGTKKIE